MDKHSHGKRSHFSLFILVLLGLTALATGYFLYFQEPISDQPAPELAAKVVNQQTRTETPQHKLQGTLSKEDKDTLNVAQGWNEFQSPLDQTASPKDTIELLSGLYFRALQPAPLKKPKPGQIIEEQLAADQTAPAAPVQTAALDTTKTNKSLEDKKTAAGPARPDSGTQPAAPSETKDAGTKAVSDQTIPPTPEPAQTLAGDTAKTETSSKNKETAAGPSKPDSGSQPAAPSETKDAGTKAVSDQTIPPTPEPAQTLAGDTAKTETSSKNKETAAGPAKPDSGSQPAAPSETKDAGTKAVSDQTIPPTPEPAQTLAGDTAKTETSSKNKETAAGPSKPDSGSQPAAPSETKDAGTKAVSDQAIPPTPAPAQTMAGDTAKTETLTKNKETATGPAKPDSGSQPAAPSETKDSGSKATAQTEEARSKLTVEYLSPEDLSSTRRNKQKNKSARPWVANVLSTQDSETLLQTFDWLRQEKVLVYAYETEVKNKKWYRIRVGFFDTQAEAQQVGKELSRKYNLPEPWIVRPGPQELAKYYDHQ